MMTGLHIRRSLCAIAACGCLPWLGACVSATSATVSAATPAAAVNTATAAVRVETAFAPRGKALEAVLQAIASARSSIRVAAYVFTSKPVSTALLDAHKRGVDVKVVADAKENSKDFTAVRFLANEGVPVRLNDRYAILHDKFIVIDGVTVQTGSFNYTAAAATKNAENVIVLYGDKPVADTYATEWKRLWNEGKDLSPSY